MNLLVILLGFLVIAVIVIIFVIHVKHGQYSHVPGPPIDSFWLGHLMYIKKEKDTGSCMAEIVFKWALEFGQTFVFWVYHRPVVCTLHPESIKNLLITNSSKVPKSSRAYGRLVSLYGQRFLGQGIVTEIDNKVWREKRNALMHAFSIKSLRNSVAVFNSCGDELVEHLRKFADGKTEVILLQSLQKVTLNVISKAAFGLDTFGEAGKDFHIAIGQVILGLNTSISDPVNRVLPWKQQEFKRAVCDSCQFLRETGRHIAKTRMLAMQSGDTYPDDILNHLINSVKDPDDPVQQELILDDFVTFFIAGMETTANLLSFVFMEICRNEDVYQKLKDEIKNLFGTKDEVYYEDLSKLHYTDLVLRETLRLYPSLPAIFRVINERMDVGGFSIPADTEVMLNTYASGRYPDFHDEAFRFNPERHSKTSDMRPTAYHTFPFGLGPRACIGQNFALMEAKILLVKVMQNFQIHLSTEQSYEIAESTTIRPKHGVKCTLTVLNSQ